MKTNQNKKTETVILSSIILGLSAISSYAKPNQYSNQSPHQHKAQPTKTVAKQHPGYTHRLPSNRKTVTFGNILYYIVGDIFYTHNYRGYKAVAKPRGYISHKRYASPRTSRYINHNSKGRHTNRR